MNDKLRARAVRGVAWKSVEQFAAQALRFLFTVLLARLLSPVEFGLIGMLAIIIEVSRTLFKGGFGAAIIQKKQVSPAELNTVWMVNLVSVVVIYLILYGAAPWVAQFYREPQLTGLLRLLAVGLLFNAPGYVHNILLTKRIDFKSLTRVKIQTLLYSGIIGVVLALNGAGVYSLAAQAIAFNFFSSILYMRATPWAPTREFSFKALKEMWAYGSRLLVSGFLTTFFDNLYLLVIGKFFTVGQVGFYSQAKRLQIMPTKSLTGVMNSVTFPTFALIQDDPDRMRRGFRKSLKILSLLNSTMLVGMILTAHPLILTLFTEKWLPVVPYFQLLCIGGLLYPIQSVNLNILKVVGRSDLVLRLSVIKMVLRAGFIFAVILGGGGILELLYAAILGSILTFGITAVHSGKFIDYSLRTQTMDILPFFLLPVLSALGMAAISAWLPTSALVKLVCLGVGFLVLQILLVRLFQPESLGLIREVYREQRSRGRKQG